MHYFVVSCIILRFHLLSCVSVLFVALFCVSIYNFTFPYYIYVVFPCSVLCFRAQFHVSVNEV